MYALECPVEVSAVRTTIDLPSDLLDEAMELGATRTKRETVIAALREYVRRRQIEGFRSRLGTYDIDLTLEDLERLRADD